MQFKFKSTSSLVCFYILILSQAALCAVRLPRLISDGMILQRDTDLKIWGWADANESVNITFNGKTYNTSADSNGRWSLILDKSQAGGPHTMEIAASNQITLKNIMLGDVWVCSGQSNMELTMERLKYHYPDTIAQAFNPAIRQFLVPDEYDFKKPRENVSSGRWESANPQSILNFTAVGYFFAKELYEKYNVPIGLINASLGGSPAQAWMSEEALKQFPEYYQTAQKFKDNELIRKIESEDKTVSDNWYKLLDETDPGLDKDSEKWFAADLDTCGWKTIELPDFLPTKKNGSVWFRKELDIPEALAGKPAKLWMGRIKDADKTYVNGRLVGQVTYEWPPRIYDVPANLIKAGKNVITVRVISNSGIGRFYPEKPYELVFTNETIDLKGQWQYKLGAVMEPLPGKTFVQWQPLGLFNGEIAPLLNYKIKGVIWYQGESNTGKPYEYRDLFTALIADWRTNWNQGDFPFLYVQLANFMDAKDKPSQSGWAELREAQLKTLSVPNTAMAVTIDIGEWNDIHPLNKKDVGKRLALAARKIAYGENDLVYSGPIYQSMQIQDNKIILTFSHIGSGLIAKDGPLQQFAIAGSDKKFVWANAKIEDDKVILWHEDITEPKAVRYAWADNPEGANLYNKEGLPASPFRTDDN